MLSPGSLFPIRKLLLLQVHAAERITTHKACALLLAKKESITEILDCYRRSAEGQCVVCLFQNRRDFCGLLKLALAAFVPHDTK
jgi:hypothetical protein